MKENSDSGKWLTVREASDASGYSTEYIRQLIRLGDVEAVKRSYIYFVSEKSLMEYKDKKTHVN